MVLTVALVVVWGMGHRLYDTLAPSFTAAFNLSDYEWALTHSIYNVVYIVGAIPAALYAMRLGYKATILLGLGCVCVGAFTLYPATETHTVSYFFVAVAIMAFGWIILEVTANPLAASLGSPKNFVQRLNLAQSFYPIGAMAGVWAGRWLIGNNLSQPKATATNAITHPYIVFGAAVMLIAFLFEEARFPAVASDRIRGRLHLNILSIIKRPLFALAMLAQFCGVIVLTQSGQAGRALLNEAPVLSTVITDWLLWSTAAFLAGRVAGTLLMSWMAPARVLVTFAAAGAVMAFLAVMTNGVLAMVGIVGVRFFMSVIWPTVLGLAIHDAGDDMKLATAILCIAAAAGGVVYEIVAVMLHLTAEPHIGMLLVTAGFSVVLCFAWAHQRRAAG
jgi:FHS family L-fucose permease-like MFS transporter